jgi:hypothetical protein
MDHFYFATIAATHPAIGVDAARTDAMAQAPTLDREWVSVDQPPECSNP